MSNSIIGTIALSTQVPTGWTLCDGKTISKKQLPECFPKLLTAMNLPSAQEKIKIPDLTNLFVVGAPSKTKLNTFQKVPDSHYHMFQYSDIPVHDNINIIKAGLHMHEFPDHWFEYVMAHPYDHQEYMIEIKGKTDFLTKEDGLHSHKIEASSIKISGGPQASMDSIKSNEGVPYTWSFPKYYALNYIIYIGEG